LRPVVLAEPKRAAGLCSTGNEPFDHNGNGYQGRLSMPRCPTGGQALVEVQVGVTKVCRTVHINIEQTDFCMNAEILKTESLNLANTIKSVFESTILAAGFNKET
jgi:hypothetical protein